MNTTLFETLRRREGCGYISMAAVLHFHGPHASGADCAEIIREVAPWFEGHVDARDYCLAACADRGVSAPVCEEEAIEWLMGRLARSPHLDPPK